MFTTLEQTKLHLTDEASATEFLVQRLGEFGFPALCSGVLVAWDPYFVFFCATMSVLNSKEIIHEEVQIQTPP